MKNALITGTSSGLGYGLADHLLTRGWHVLGCSRRGCDLPGIADVTCDLSNPTQTREALATLLAPVDQLELVVLNAGILGEIRDLVDTPLDDVKHVMEVNVWANKTIMDWLHAWGKPIRQVIMISSGASILGNKGWGGYALSKAGLNMLAKLYAHEFPATHISALAPGIIDTAMMDHLCEAADARAFPALERLREARGTAAMPDAAAAATRIVSVLDRLKQKPSGEFVDIRELLDPEAFAKLYGKQGS